MEMKGIFRNLPTLETDRFILRKIKTEDLNDMYEYCSSDEVSQYMAWDTHETIEDTKTFLASILGLYEEDNAPFWGIVLKENNKLIGTINFKLNVAHKVGELGYVLSHKYWGKGIMTEAVYEVIRFGFKTLKLVRIEGKCFEENVGSQHVMKKAGLKYEGTIRKGLLVKGKYKNLKLFSILIDEFK